MPNPAAIFMPPTSPRDQTISSSTMSNNATATAGPKPTPLPKGPNRPDEPSHEGASSDDNDCQQQQQQEDGGDGQAKLIFDYPKLRLKILDLNHPGATRFLGAVNAADVLRKCVQTVLELLYTSPTSDLVPPPTRSVTLVLEDMGGVAYTKGSDLDDDHKEIRTCSFPVSSSHTTHEIRQELMDPPSPPPTNNQTSPSATSPLSKKLPTANPPTLPAPTKSKVSSSTSLSTASSTTATATVPVVLSRASPIGSACARGWGPSTGAAISFPSSGMQVMRRRRTFWNSWRISLVRGR